MKYIPMGLRSRAFMVNLAFAKEFGIPLNDPVVVKTPTEYTARMKEWEEEMQREREAREVREVVKRNHPLATAFSFILNWRLPDKEKLLRLTAVAKKRRNEVKLPTNLSLAKYIVTLATKRHLNIAKKLKKCVEVVNATKTAHKQFRDTE